MIPSRLGCLDLRAIASARSICVRVVVQGVVFAKSVGIVTARVQHADCHASWIQPFGAFRVDPDALSSAVGSEVAQDLWLK